MKQCEFIQQVYEYYESHGRKQLPWRVERTPFNAFLSEVMLQQTQVPRVIEKFNLFKERFNSFEELANAPQSQIVMLWQGLGYNRRALYLHKAAKMIVSDFNGELPSSPSDLQKLPGIGPATAASISVYAHNQPHPYIETNIRAVFIHHFFAEQELISDEEILPLVKETLDYADPYNWYSALMDYGTMIKSIHKNPSRKSKNHTVQSRFEGSRRQVRGKIIKILSENSGISLSSLSKKINDERSESVIRELINEAFIEELSGKLLLK